MDRRRTWLSVVAGVAAVIVLAAGIAGAVDVAGERAAPGASSASAASLSAEALAASAPTTSTAPPTTVAAQATTVPRPTTTAVKAPVASGSVKVEVVPARPKVGETVRFVVTARHPANCCYVHLTPGDGGNPALAPGAAMCSAGSDGGQRTEFTHVYNTPGTRHVVVRAEAGRACDELDALRAVFPGGLPTGAVPAAVSTPALPPVQAQVTVVVAPGVTTSQGPAAPQAEVGIVPGTNGEATLRGSAFDHDGWVSVVEVDWGDGTPATVLAQPQPCRVGDNGWPVGSPLLLGSLPPGAPISWAAMPATHAYHAPGTYTVKVTAVSSGCDGGTRQRATRTLSFSRGA